MNCWNYGARKQKRPASIHNEAGSIFQYSYKEYGYWELLPNPLRALTIDTPIVPGKYKFPVEGPGYCCPPIPRTGWFLLCKYPRDQNSLIAQVYQEK